MNPLITAEMAALRIAEPTPRAPRPPPSRSGR